MLHVHLTGGEPLARDKTWSNWLRARERSGLYTNLITSGIGLKQRAPQGAREAGLDHIQLSFQDSREDSANWIAGTKSAWT